MSSIHDFKSVTDRLDIYPNELGAVLLDFESLGEKIFAEEWMYYSPNQEEWWIKGWVGDRAHVTLRYGLLDQGVDLKNEIEDLLRDLPLPSVKAINTKIFGDPEGPYAAIVLEVFQTPELMEFHRRLSYLPHVDTFTPWVPHVTVAYVKREYADLAVALSNHVFIGQTLIPTRINLGEDKY